MARPTLLDIAIHNNGDDVAGLIEEVSKAHPEIAMGYARTIKGTSYMTKVCTALPTASFRNANEGVTPSKATFENRRVETFILNPRFECDRAVADGSEDGPEAYIADESIMQMEAAMQLLAKQFYYGRGTGDAKGHPGLIDSYDSTNMVVDAGGTTASTGSSVWAVKFGPKDVAWVWGANGELKLSETRIETVYPSANSPMEAYVRSMLAYPGVQVGSTRSIGRIKKLTADSGKTLTDALISQLIEKFSVGAKPDLLLMSRRSLGQLQRSRTATNLTGVPAPVPEESFKIPIQVTDSILDTESLTL